jgi:hypothetical protein
MIGVAYATYEIATAYTPWNLRTTALAFNILFYFFDVFVI